MQRSRRGMLQIGEHGRELLVAWTLTGNVSSGNILHRGFSSATCFRKRHVALDVFLLETFIMCAHDREAHSTAFFRSGESCESCVILRRWMWEELMWRMWNLFLLQAEMMVPAIALDSCEVIILSQGPSLGERAPEHAPRWGYPNPRRTFHRDIFKKYSNMGSNIFKHHRYGKRYA